MTITNEEVVSALREHYGAALEMYNTVRYSDPKDYEVDMAKSEAIMSTLEQIASDLGCLKELQANW